jgi:hypothetical protein
MSFARGSCDPLAELGGTWIDKEKMMCVLICTGRAGVFAGTRSGRGGENGCRGASEHAAAGPAHKGISVISADDLLMKVI